MYFGRYTDGNDLDGSYLPRNRRRSTVAHDDVLTYEQVAAAFDHVPAAVEPKRSL